MEVKAKYYTAPPSPIYDVYCWQKKDVCRYLFFNLFQFDHVIQELCVMDRLLQGRGGIADIVGAIGNWLVTSGSHDTGELELLHQMTGAD